MKSSSLGSPTLELVRSLPAGSRHQDTEFLPAALEIVETPPSPLGRAIAGTIGLFLCLSIGWSILGKVDISATSQGRIIPTGRSKLIQPFETGVVRAIRVVDGQTVKEGDVLIELDPTADASDEKRLRFSLNQDRLDIARLRALLSGDMSTFVPSIDIPSSLAERARSHMQTQFAEHAAKLSSLDRQIAQKDAEGREVRATISRIETALPLLREQRDIKQKLLGNQFGSRVAYLQVQQQVIELEHELVVQKHRLAENGEAKASLDQQRLSLQAEYRKSLLADLAKAETLASDHEEEVAKSAMRKNLRTLRAPVGGTVQQLAVHTLGGIVTPAQQLMVIVPEGAGLEIETTLANKDVGFVQPGQAAEIKVEAFTYTRYGLLHGTVTSVSREAVVSAEGSQPGRSSRKDGGLGPNDEAERQAGQPSYMVRIALAETGIQTERGFSALEPGMAVTAEIKTGERRIISFLLSPLQRLANESLRER
jgi:hemolysin D